MKRMNVFFFLFGFSIISLPYAIAMDVEDFYYHGVHLPSWIWTSVVGAVVVLLLKIMFRGWDKRISSLEDWRVKIVEQKGGLPLSSDIADRCEKRLNYCEQKHANFRDCIYHELEESERRIVKVMDEHLKAVQTLTEERMRNMEQITNQKMLHIEQMFKFIKDHK